MPVREMAPERSSEHVDLVTELADEWRNPRSQTGEPLIMIERDRQGKPAHVYVVWSIWSPVDRGERSEIIVEAAEKCLPRDDALNISIAMGLTPQEAKAWGLKF